MLFETCNGGDTVLGVEAEFGKGAAEDFAGCFGIIRDLCAGWSRLRRFSMKVALW